MNNFKIIYDGRDITGKLAPRLMSIELEDKRGGARADDLTIRLDDAGSVLELPELGKTIKFYLGDPETGLTFKGIFTIDEIEDGGAPDYIELRASSVDFTKGLKIRKERFFENTTIGDIVNFIAGEHNLTASVSPAAAGQLIPHITQTNESDLNLLNRIAKDYGGFFALKNMTLIFAEEASGRTASGQALPEYALDRRATNGNYRFVEKSRRQDFTGARAAWYDTANAVKKWEIAGDTTKIKTLPEIYANADVAKKAAIAAFDRAARGKVSMSRLRLAGGNAALIPEQPVKLSGFKPKVESIDWIIESLRHSVRKSGFSTEIELSPLK